MMKGLCQLNIGTCHLPHTRVKSRATAPKHFQHPLKGVQGGDLGSGSLYSGNNWHNRLSDSKIMFRRFYELKFLHFLKEMKSRKALKPMLMVTFPWLLRREMRWSKNGVTGRLWCHQPFSKWYLLELYLWPGPYGYLCQVYDWSPYLNLYSFSCSDLVSSRLRSIKKRGTCKQVRPKGASWQSSPHILCFILWST